MTWHDPLVDGWPPDSDSSAPLTPRIDIAVIADNGTGLSAPSFVSILLPAHQVRNYGRTPDGTPRLHSVDYAPDLSRIPVFDPFLYWRADWEDVAIRDDDDRPAWERTFKDGSVAIVPETGVTYERIGALRNILAVTGE